MRTKDLEGELLAMRHPLGEVAAIVARALMQGQLNPDQTQAAREAFERIESMRTELTATAALLSAAGFARVAATARTQRHPTQEPREHSPPRIRPV